MTWLDTFLPKLRCPHTAQLLRHATSDDKMRAGLPIEAPALASQDGTHVYPVVTGIPHLLPGAAINIPNDKPRPTNAD